MLIKEDRIMWIKEKLNFIEKKIKWNDKIIIRFSAEHLQNHLLLLRRYFFMNHKWWRQKTLLLSEISTISILFQIFRKTSARKMFWFYWWYFRKQSHGEYAFIVSNCYVCYLLNIATYVNSLIVYLFELDQGLIKKMCK